MAWHSKLARPLVVLAGLLAIGTWTTGKSEADDKVGASTTVPSSFSHKAHADRVDINKCAGCHASTTAGKPPPTSRGHAPCLASGCHIDEFLSTGPRAKKEDLASYKAAGQFCATCHKSVAGEPPSRFSKARADALFENKVAADYHVEMNHQEHTERTACSSCHRVDPNSFELVSGGPSHQQCATCHTDSEQPMTNCASCHGAPGPSEYFTKARKSSDVRVCDPESGDSRPCFKHERPEHRYLPDNTTQLECSSCHFMFKQKSHQGMSYVTIADVKAAPMMNNVRDLAHQSCGIGGCHKRDVDDSMGTGRCTQCHSAKFMANSLTD